jgi:hypothetical protein
MTKRPVTAPQTWDPDLQIHSIRKDQMNSASPTYFPEILRLLRPFNNTSIDMMDNTG